MADDKTELPEGTDRIIAGATAPTVSNSGTLAVGGDAPSPGGDEGDVLIVTEVEVEEISAEPSGATTGDRTTSGQSDDRGVMRKLRSGGEKLSGQAADKARGLVGQGLERSAEALANVGRLVGDTADGLDERLGTEYGDYARRAASAIEEAANGIASKDADELIDDTRNLVRKSPGVALAGAAIVGFALARLIKSGLATGDDERNEGNSRERKSSEG